MRVFNGETFADVYESALYHLLNEYNYELSPRNMKVREIPNAALVINDPYSCLYDNKKRSSQFKYIAAELVWYFTGRNDVGFISKFAKFWDKIKNKDGSLNSAYGNLIFKEHNAHGKNQYSWALEKLKEDKDSRQAILHFNKQHHQYDNNKDFVCTLNGIFQIRNNSLNFTVDMRSNDIILGTPTDIPFFCTLQQQMLVHLQKYYPDLRMGTYTHIAHSLHIYERHFELGKKMLDFPFEEKYLPEMREAFIDESGVPLKMLVEIENEIENEEEYKFKDDLLHQWIIDALNSNI